jgi:hypothetical protein
MRKVTGQQPERQETNTSIKKAIPDFDWHLKCRMNRSVDLLNFREAKSSFLLFSDSTPRLDIPRKRAFSHGKVPHRKKLQLQSMLLYNSDHVQKYQKRMQAEKEARVNEAASYYNSLQEKMKETQKRQRQHPGFFTKLVARKTSSSFENSFLTSGNHFFLPQNIIQDVYPIY